MSASMLIYSKCIKDMIREQTRAQSPVPAKNFSIVKSDEDGRFKSCSFKFKFSSLFLSKSLFAESPTQSSTGRQSRRKREQKSLCSYQSKRKRESTHHSSRNRGVPVGERREEEKKKKERGGGII
jgi:hypothetical protein